MTDRPSTGPAGIESTIRSLLEQRLATGHAAGAVVAVTDREQTLAMISCGSSSDATGQRLGFDSLIRLGSLSKSFVALLVMQEVERGRLRLGDRVSDILPWCRLREPYGPITVHHLLTHTAGLPRGSDASTDPLFAVHQLRHVEPGGPPGEHFHYSNDGWKLVGVLLEEVAGEPLDRLLRDRVLGPLGMTTSVGRIEANEITSLVSRYCRQRPGRPLTAHAPLAELAWTPYAAADGCVAATVDDMCRYARMLLSRGRAPSGRLVTPNSFAAVVHPWVPDDQTGYGRGWYGYGWWIYDRNGSNCYLHPGYQPGLSCMLMVDPAAGLAAFAAASGTFDVRTPCEYALSVVHAALTGQPLPSLPRTPSITRIFDAEDYAGVYQGDGQFTLTPDGDGLRFCGDGVDVAVEQVDPIMLAGFVVDVLVVPTPPFDRHLLEFDRGEDGTVVRAYHGDRRYGRSPHPPDDISVPADWRAYCGTYRSWNPTVPTFTVVARRGRLLLLDEWETVPLVQLDVARFRVGDNAWSPERLHFDALTPRGATRVVAADGEGAWYRVSEAEEDRIRPHRTPEVVG